MGTSTGGRAGTSCSPRRRPDDELEALNAELMARHWHRWVDEPVPALNGRTPRQAAATPEGRERLEALLTDFEWHGGAPVGQTVRIARDLIG